MTVGELLGRVSSIELSEWMAYFSIEPFGEMRADLRAGIVASTVANVNRDPKKKRDPYKPEEFIPDFEGKASQEQENDPQKIYGMMRAWAMMAKGSE